MANKTIHFAQRVLGDATEEAIAQKNTPAVASLARSIMSDEVSPAALPVATLFKVAGHLAAQNPGSTQAVDLLMKIHKAGIGKKRALKQVIELAPKLKRIGDRIEYLQDVRDMQSSSAGGSEAISQQATATLAKIKEELVARATSPDTPPKTQKWLNAIIQHHSRFGF